MIHAGGKKTKIGRTILTFILAIGLAFNALTAYASTLPETCDETDAALTEPNDEYSGDNDGTDDALTEPNDEGSGDNGETDAALTEPNDEYFGDNDETDAALTEPDDEDFGDNGAEFFPIAESVDIPEYDPQPLTMEEVQEAIDAYEAEYLRALEEEGFEAALNVARPRWQHEVAAELMPEGYNCQLVDWDEDFGALYYTFFPNPATMSYGEGRFVNKPPEGPNIKTVFQHIVGDTKVDSLYSNVAIATFDDDNQFGAMWAEEKLDLNIPFSTEMYLHLGHQDGKTGKVADGMTFTMHNCEAALTDMIGGEGEGLGVFTGRNSKGESGSYLPNSLVIEFDTYFNGNDGWSTVVDPVSPDSVEYAHCAFIYPRQNNRMKPILPSDHKNTYYFEPTQEWVKFTAEWEPEYDDEGTLGGILTYSFDGAEQVEVIDDVESVFNGSEVWWGFTGATGQTTALQAAAITELPTQEFIAVKTVKNSDGDDVDGKTANVEDTLTYSIEVTAHVAVDGIGPVIIEDELSEYAQYAGGDVTVTASDGKFAVTPSLEGGVLTIYTGVTLAAPGDCLTVTFNIVVLPCRNGTIVENTATAKESNNKLGKPYTTNTTEVTIVNESRKAVDGNSATGVKGAAVCEGDVITYKITYVNNNDETANLIITDALPGGLEFVSANDQNGAPLTGYTSADRSIAWTNITGVSAGEEGSVTITARVTEEAYEDGATTVTNTARIIWILPGSILVAEDYFAENPLWFIHKQYRLPETGGGGILKTTLTGIFLTASGVLCAVLFSNRQRKMKQPNL